MIFLKLSINGETKLLVVTTKYWQIRFFESDQTNFFGQEFLMKILLQIEASQFYLARLCEYGIESPHLVVPES